MLQKCVRTSFLSLLGAMVVITTSCSKNEQRESKQPLSGILQPAPGDKTSKEAQLKRFRGQTQFLSMRYKQENFAKAEAAAMRGAVGGDGTAKREVEESDIFKLEGNLVYLLNNYRGIQVVSYANGADKPELLARVPSTGNYPQDMFFQKETRRLYVVEKYYFSSEDYDYRNRSSRLLVYHIGKSDIPERTQEVEIAGEAQAIQRVGNVLYVAAIQFGSGDNMYENTTGLVHSYALDAKDGVKEVQTVQLAHPLAYSWNQEPMSIVEVPRDNNTFSYYVIAKLSKSFWSWGEANNFLEVLDITNPKGAVKPLMVVSAKGTLQEKSQAFIKNDSLIVVSNFNSKYRNNEQMIAVESFALPGAKPKTISSKEAERRKLTIELELEKITDGKARYEAEKKLVADTKTGLAGQFVLSQVKEAEAWRNQPAEYILSKIAPDRLTVLGGDQENDRPQIQDVRVAGNRVYIFWVPAKLVDPLDIVDISAPDKELKHLGRTRFRGWVERSYPVQFNGKEYIVALGKVLEENSEFPSQVPQVRVFEIPENLEELEGEDREAKRVASVDLGSLSDSWISFQGQDKEIPLVPLKDAGKFVLMFPFTSWKDGARGAGAKIVGIDLNERGKKVISEATLSARNMDWIRRVFANPGVKITNTFSDKELAAFSTAEKGYKLLSVLELARNVEGYVTLNGAGIQIVEDYTYDDAGKGKAQLTLRMVDAKKADSEKTAVKAEAKIAMPFRQHLLAKDGALYLIGTNYRSEKEGEGENVEYKSYLDVSVARATVEGAKITITEPVTASVPQRNRRWWGGGFRGGFALEGRSMPFFLPFYEDIQVVELPKGGIAVSLGGEIRVISVNKERLDVQTVKTAGCVEKADDLSLTALSGQLGVAYTVDEGDVAGVENAKYERSFFATATIDDGQLKCGKSINIPGAAKFLIAEDHLISEDSFTPNPRKEKDEEGKVRVNIWEQTQTNLFSLALDSKAGIATLVDSYDPSNVSTAAMRQVGGKILFLEGQERWGYRSYEGSDSLSVLGFSNKLFEKEPYSLGLPFKPHSVVSVVGDPDGAKGDLLVLVTSYRKGAVLGLNLERGTSPSVKKVAKVNTRFETDKAEDSFSLLGGSGWYGGSVQSVNFTASNRSFEFAEGLFGVEQIVVEK